MAIYHIKKNGEPGRCKAFLRECPQGGPEDHYTSKEDAQKSFELRQGGSFGPVEKEALTIVEKNDLRTIDAKLLKNAKKMADASGAELIEIQANTEPLAIIRAARVEAIVELRVPELTPSYPRASPYDAFAEAPD
jgi:hypothetical protein